VYVLKESTAPLPPEGEYLTQLDTPEYRSLKIGNNVYRIHYKGEDV
jgi:hypothetical protein